MTAPWRGVHVAVVGFVSDDQPGFVACELVDADGRRWAFVEKVPIVTARALDAGSAYPQPGTIAGEVVARGHDPTGREVVWFDTARPWGIASVDGQTRFQVLASALVED
ncbi:MAG: hypothetical protein IPL61_00125 [Myxococcales bacterium]|nr:hypothetical protein [Myxococcales bacterium]